MSGNAWVLAIVGTVGFGVYGLWLAWVSATRARANRSVRRAQRSAGASYSQLNSVTGRMRPPKLGISVWFLLAVCALVIFAIWGK